MRCISARRECWLLAAIGYTLLCGSGAGGQPTGSASEARHGCAPRDDCLRLYMDRFVVVLWLS